VASCARALDIDNFAHRVEHRLLPLLKHITLSTELSTQFSNSAFAVSARHFEHQPL
jgi:hypothetical protein